MKINDFSFESNRSKEFLSLMNSLHVTSYEYMGCYIIFRDINHEIVYLLYAKSYPNIKLITPSDNVGICADSYMLFVLYILMFEGFTGIVNQDN